MEPSQSPRKDIKELLLLEGVVTQDVLNKIIEEHERKNRPLLDVLFQTESYDPVKLLHVFKHHYKYHSINPTAFIVGTDLIKLVPLKIAKQYCVLPVSKLDQTLTVAFANPTHLKASDELRSMTGMRIKVVVAQADLLKKCIEKYYADMPAGQEQSLSAESSVSLDDLAKEIKVERQETAETQGPDLLKISTETPIIKLINMILHESIRRHASDIFIEPWENHVRVRARVDGLLEEVARPPKTLGEALVSRVKVISQLNIAEHRIPQDGRFKLNIRERNVDMRVSILPTAHGEKVCIRILDTQNQSHEIEKLGFTEREQKIIKNSAKRSHGMILVTGPTGSGKTTTLYSILKHLDSPEINITTVEDPVEYQLPGINQVHVREAIGLTFPASLRSILRQDPDIILIGEIRDRDTLDIAVKAALTGHLVLSTLHTNDAASAITRMVNMKLEPFLIASTVIMISAQRLVRRLCERCKLPHDVPADILKSLNLDPANKYQFFKPKKCTNCRDTGYKGRTVITELLQLTPEIRSLITNNALADEIKRRAMELEMTTLRQSALAKALAGETSIEEVFRVTSADTGVSSTTEDDVTEIKKAS